VNPFKPNDPARLEFLAEERKAKQQLAELQHLANDLMLDQRYKHFADLIKEAEDNTVDLLLSYKEPDPYKYKAKVDEFLIELRVYRNILSSSKDLANPRPKDNVSFIKKFIEGLR
jgi:hypothetical protein